MVIQLCLEKAPLRLKGGLPIRTHSKHGVVRRLLQFKSQLKPLNLLLLGVEIFDGEVSIMGSLEEVSECWLVQLINEVLLLTLEQSVFELRCGLSHHSLVRLDWFRTLFASRDLRLSLVSDIPPFLLVHCEVLHSQLPLCFD